MLVMILLVKILILLDILDHILFMRLEDLTISFWLLYFGIVIFFEFMGFLLIYLIHSLGRDKCEMWIWSLQLSILFYLLLRFILVSSWRWSWWARESEKQIGLFKRWSRRWGWQLAPTIFENKQVELFQVDSSIVLKPFLLFLIIIKRSSISKVLFFIHYLFINSLILFCFDHSLL